MDAVLEEIAYALDELGAAGVTLQANMHGQYLGEDLYEPMWAELDKRGAVSLSFPQLPLCWQLLTVRTVDDGADGAADPAGLTSPGIVAGSAPRLQHQMLRVFLSDNLWVS